MKMMKKMLAMLLIVGMLAGFMIPAHAAETAPRMSLEMSAPARLDLDEEMIEYTVSVANTERLANMTVYVELDPNFVKFAEQPLSPWVDNVSAGWTVIASDFRLENGKIKGAVVLGNYAGLTTDEPVEIFSICADTKGVAGLALAEVTAVEPSVYVGDVGEAFVPCNLKNRVVRTVFGEGGMGGGGAYTFRQSTQLGLIEPWFLRSNAYIRDESGAYLSAEQIVASFVDYGFYFVRKDALSQVTKEAILNSDEAVIVTKADGAGIGMGSLGGMISADYDEGIYTYELDTTICVLAYVEDELGRYYDSVRERNIAQLAASAKNNQNFDETERQVYRRMEEMFSAVTAHRATFENIPDLPVVSAPEPVKDQFEGYRSDLTVRHSANIVLIEPWGLQLNGYVSGQYEDYGLVVSTETDDLDDMLSDKDTRVFSLSNGCANVEVGDTSKISGVYNQGIYTYQMNRNLYAAFFVKDSEGVYHFGPVRTRNILSMVTEQAANEARPDTERAVYQAMLNMNTDVLAHRAKFGLN